MVMSPKRRRYRRVRTPTILQMEAVECGAAALAIVLARHGRWVPLEQLRIDCGVSRDGSKASNIVRAAGRHGLIGKGYRMEPGNLYQLELPSIVFWNFNHFVVVEGFGRGKVYLNDPACGPRIVSAREFDDAFTGVVLEFERSESFQPGGTRPNVMRSLARRFHGAGWGLFYVLLSTLALVLTALVVPTYSKIFVDDILIRDYHDWLRPLLLVMSLTLLLQVGVTWLQQYALMRVEVKLALSSSSRFLWHVLQLPIDFFQQRFAGDISSRVQSNDRVAQMLGGELATNAVNMAMIALYVLVMCSYDLLLTGIGVAVAAMNVAALQWVGRVRTDQSRILQQDYGKLLSTSMGGLETIETLKATGGEASFFSRWSGYQAKVTNAEQRLNTSTTMLLAVPQTLSSWVRRAARDGRTDDHGRTGRLSGADDSLHGSGQQARFPGERTAGAQERCQPPGRRGQLSERAGARRRRRRGNRQAGRQRAAEQYHLRLQPVRTAAD